MKLYFTKNNIDILKKLLKIPENSKVAIKMHMGEKGNTTHISAEETKPIINILRSLNLKPFIVDTPTLYLGGRFTEKDYLQTAKENGFSEETMDCPIIISNDHHKVQTKHMNFEVCKPMYDTEYMIVLTHVKGHCCVGFGAAIKNLSMGGATKKSKGDMHALGEPELIGECKLCKTCEKLCPFNAITITDKWNLNKGTCFGCDVCIVNCPHRILKPKVALIDELLAEGAWATTQNKKQVIYINIIKRITKECDCRADTGGILADDIGILIGTDPVAIDQASLDLINKQKPDIFTKSNHKDPQLQINFAEKLEMGKRNYKIEEI